MKIKKVTSLKEKQDAFFIRECVFVKEQKVPVELELDEFDSKAIHFVGYKNDKPIAASRLRSLDNSGKLERICVLKDYRGKAYGREMIKEMEKQIVSSGISNSILNAQTHAVSFYKRLGYETISEPFMDAGIPHVTMKKKLNK